MKHVLVATLVFAVAAFAGEMKPLKIGRPVPSFSLKNHDGKEYDLKTILKENKYTVLLWVSTECPVSNAYNARMAKLQEAFAKRGIAFVGINSNKEENVKTIAVHAKDNSFKFPVLKDEKNKIADLYAAQVTPEVFVLNPEGKLLYHGRIDDSRNASKVSSNDLSDTLEKLLAGKEVTATELKAFGCTIKRVSTN